MAYEHYDINDIRGELEPSGKDSFLARLLLSFFLLFFPPTVAFRLALAIGHLWFSIVAAFMKIGFLVSLPFIGIYWLCSPAKRKELHPERENRKHKEFNNQKI